MSASIINPPPRNDDSIAEAMQYITNALRRLEAITPRHPIIAGSIGAAECHLGNATSALESATEKLARASELIKWGASRGA